MRLPSRATSTPAISPAGTLMFSRVPWGSGTSSISPTMRAVNAAAVSKSKRSPRRKSISRARDCCETAMPGMPSTTPSSAAATVPEYVMSSPRFEPWLMPETIRSALKPSISPSEAKRTQSTGVPSHAWPTVPSPKSTSWIHNGRRVVIERAIAERLPSGAITASCTSCTPRSARRSACSPSASIPSSLVSSTRSIGPEDRRASCHPRPLAVMRWDAPESLLPASARRRRRAYACAFMPAPDLAHRSGLGIGSLALMAIAAVCLVLGGVAVYARATILDEDAFTARAVSTLSSGEGGEEVADRLSNRLVEKAPGLLRFQPVVEYEAQRLTVAPEFSWAFAAAARRLQRSLFEGYTMASFDVGPAGALLKATVAQREPRLQEPLARVDASDLMDFSGGGVEGTLRRLAPTARRSAVAGVPALVLAVLLLGAGVLAAQDRRRGLHAAALAVGATGGALVAGWTAARAFTLALFDTNHGDAVVGTIWDAFLGDLRLWSMGLAGAGIV